LTYFKGVVIRKHLKRNKFPSIDVDFDYMSEANNKKSVWIRTVIWYYRNLKPFFYEHKWLILIFLDIMVFILGFFGFSEVYPDQSILNRIYLTMQLFTLKSGDFPGSIPLFLNIARFFAPALTFISIVVIITGSFIHHLETFMLRVWYKDHVIICGLGYIGPVIVKHFCERGFVVVAIEKDSTRSEIEYCKTKGAIVLTGDATESRILKRAQVKKAKYLFAVTGDDELNAKVIGQVKDEIKGREHPLNCFVHIVDLNFANFLRAVQIPVQGEPTIILEFINIYQNSSLCMLNCIPSLFPANTAAPDFHILIIGIGRLGESLLVHVVKRWKKYYGQTPAKKIRITIIDRDAHDKKKSIIARYKAINTYCDIDDQEMELSSSKFYEAEFLFDRNDQSTINTIFVCTADESLNFATALYINQKLKNNSIPIAIRTVQRKGFADFFDDLSKLNAEHFRNLHAFPLVSCGCCIRTLIEGVNEVIAQALHDNYLMQKKMGGTEPGSEPAMKLWKDLDLEFKEQNRDQAKKMGLNLQEKGYTIISRSDWDEPLFVFKDDGVLENLAILEHERWMNFMLGHGWQLGDSKDLEKKIHPNLIPWENLTEPVKDYDRNFIREYPSILALVDLKIVIIKELSPEKPGPSENLWNCSKEKNNGQSVGR